LKNKPIVLTAIVLVIIFLAPSFLVRISTSDFTQCDPNEYSPWADGNEDGQIDIFDVVYVATKYGTNGCATKSLNITNWPQTFNVNITLEQPTAISEFKSEVKEFENAFLNIWYDVRPPPGEAWLMHLMCASSNTGDGMVQIVLYDNTTGEYFPIIATNRTSQPSLQWKALSDYRAVATHDVYYRFWGFTSIADKSFKFAYVAERIQ
jgi:hypothetical protein